jgi:ribosomal protein S14
MHVRVRSCEKLLQLHASRAEKSWSTQYKAGVGGYCIPERPARVGSQADRVSGQTSFFSTFSYDFRPSKGVKLGQNIPKAPNSERNSHFKDLKMHCDSPPEPDAFVEITPVKLGKVCVRCHQTLPIRAFEHTLTPARAKALGYKAERKVVQDWKECRECTRARGAARKPVTQLTRAKVLDAVDKGRVPARLMSYALSAAETRSKTKHANAMARAKARQWAAPWTYALKRLGVDAKKAQMLRIYNARAPDKGANEVIGMFLDAYIDAVALLRGTMRLRMRDDTGREAWRRIRYLETRTSEHYRTNPRSVRPRGRPPVDLRPAQYDRVCMETSVWGDYFQYGEIGRLRSLYNDIPLRQRGRRFKKIPLLLDVEQERCLLGYDVDRQDEGVRERLDELARVTTRPTTGVSEP